MRWLAAEARFDQTWFSRKYPEHREKTIAYFCAEFGLHSSVPIYSGGLGVLAGDHCKSASDLGVPLVGIGILYRAGYFDQRIRMDGWQEDSDVNFNPERTPITPLPGPTDRISCRRQYVRARCLRAGFSSHRGKNADHSSRYRTRSRIIGRPAASEQALRWADLPFVFARNGSLALAEYVFFGHLATIPRHGIRMKVMRRSCS